MKDEVRPMRAALLLLSLCLASPALAASKGGVSMPDSVDVGGAKLVLNGMGVREATIMSIDVYVAGLYLPAKSRNAGAILAADQPWRLSMKFVRDVDAEKLNGAWKEGLGSKGGANLRKLAGYMSDVSKGDTMTFTYVPGAGVEVKVKGRVKGTLAGADWAKAFLGIWLGGSPPNAGLKEGMLGG